MLVKININGELLKRLDQDCTENFRTRPQTILYHLSRVYNNALDSTDTVPSWNDTTQNSDEDVQQAEHIESIELPSGIFEF